MRSQLKAINPYWAVVLSLNQTPEEEDPDEAGPGPQLRLAPALQKGEGGGLRGGGWTRGGGAPPSFFFLF